MTEDTKRSPIIITSNMESIYRIILLEGIRYDSCILHWKTSKNLQAEEVIRMMNKGAGWVIVRGSRQKVMTENTVCKFKGPDGMCTNPLVKPSIRCTEQVRKNCKEYDQKFKEKFLVDSIILEKTAQSRDV